MKRRRSLLFTPVGVGPQGAQTHGRRGNETLGSLPAPSPPASPSSPHRGLASARVEVLPEDVPLDRHVRLREERRVKEVEEEQLPLLDAGPVLRVQEVLGPPPVNPQSRRDTRSDGPRAGLSTRGSRRGGWGAGPGSSRGRGRVAPDFRNRRSVRAWSRPGLSIHSPTECPTDARCAFTETPTRDYND